MRSHSELNGQTYGSGNDQGERRLSLSGASERKQPKEIGEPNKNSIWWLPLGKANKLEAANCTVVKDSQSLVQCTSGACLAY